MDAVKIMYSKQSQSQDVVIKIFTLNQPYLSKQCKMINQHVIEWFLEFVSNVLDSMVWKELQYILLIGFATF